MQRYDVLCNNPKNIAKKFQISLKVFLNLDNIPRKRHNIHYLYSINKDCPYTAIKIKTHKKGELLLTIYRPTIYIISGKNRKINNRTILRPYVEQQSK